jgi:hypothetical protein
LSITHRRQAIRAAGLRLQGRIPIGINCSAPDGVPGPVSSIHRRSHVLLGRI